MKLSELKGTYDAIFSLGHLCLASIQLEKNNLRSFAGVVDWMASYNLSDINRALTNRFAGFMEYRNLQVVGQASDKLYLVIDSEYNIISNHDFFTHNNFPPHMAAYPEIKAKFDRRIARFLDKMEHAQNILFIRTEGTLEQAAELQDVLSKLVKHKFKVLLVQHTADVATLVDNDWNLQHVCSVRMPDKEIWDGNDALWNWIFNMITYADR
ncbi:MAG: hypothetical protein K0R57_6450 [Paenibacillaceae bacterium]|nr:hypothetical protein [Paenibacillaceae bacterium]